MKNIDNYDIIKYIIKNNATTRETAKHFGVSRQTISNRIKQSKNKEVEKIFNLHFAYRSKYKYLKSQENS